MDKEGTSDIPGDATRRDRLAPRAEEIEFFYWGRALHTTRSLRRLGQQSLGDQAAKCSSILSKNAGGYFQRG